VFEAKPGCPPYGGAVVPGAGQLLPAVCAAPYSTIALVLGTGSVLQCGRVIAYTSANSRGVELCDWGAGVAIHNNPGAATLRSALPRRLCVLRPCVSTRSKARAPPSRMRACSKVRREMACSRGESLRRGSASMPFGWSRAMLSSPPTWLLRSRLGTPWMR